MTATDAIEQLHATLDRRETPETVARLVRDSLPPEHRREVSSRLGQILATSVQRIFGWSSMATTFVAPETAARQAGKARELAALFLPEDAPIHVPLAEPGPDEDDAALEALINGFDALIGKTPGASNFKTDRLDRMERKALGLSRRRYGKLFRLAGRLERKVARQREGHARRTLVLVGKAALAPRLTVADFAGDVPTAAFVAYYAARMKLRSEFTIQGQQKPFDELCADLLAICEKNPDTSWWAIAHVFPRRDVLQRLTDQQRGQMLGIWFDILQELADRLDEIRSRTKIDTDTMIVKRGNDSSTWNLLAGAWNRARDHWIALIVAMDMDDIFDTMLPGKVMKLMAADVAAWHRMSGGGIHPDTLVWRTLPAPWLVLSGEVTCTRSDIEAACRAKGIDAAMTGWAAPRALTSVARFKPTPELVHGVTVSNPYLADYLRSAGFFSGKALKAPSIDKPA